MPLTSRRAGCADHRTKHSGRTPFTESSIGPHLMRKSTDHLRQLDKQFVWHPFTPMKLWAESDPLVITDANGMYLIDRDGRRYLDGVSSLWCNVHGHRVAVIDNAIRAQLDRVAHTT